MKTDLKKEDLISFEEEIGECFNKSMIRAPVHLYNGNEEKIIKIFQEVKEEDYIFCTWRSHYQCLLKGAPKKTLKKDILKGKSITLCYPEYNIFSSAIVTGSISIANGRALAEKLKGSDSHVWCFVGDMSSETGSFHENVKYSINHNLPITWVIEDNGKSVCTDTRKTWNMDNLSYEEFDLLQSNNKIIYYKYETKYPHAGAGKRIQF
jgi:pyruvate dehydrogenase E1 component alpha subunit